MSDSVLDFEPMPKSSRDLLTECDIQTFKAGGKGGQYQNKTESAVRLVHRSTGVTVICRDERSQYLNKSRCLERLEQKLRKLREKPKPRIATKIPRAEKTKRKLIKKRVGVKKSLRKRPGIEE
ncbi:MAG: peptide chain release factor-like protein [Chitinispirillaceae bacterium]|jgi:protein subunit release factor B